MDKNVQGTYYLPEELHRKFKVKCIMDNVSMSDKIRELIRAYTKDQKSKTK